MNNTLVINEGSQNYCSTAYMLVSCPLIREGKTEKTGESIIKTIAALPFLNEEHYASAVEFKIISHKYKLHYAIVVSTTSPSVSSSLRHEAFLNVIRSSLKENYFSFNEINPLEIENLYTNEYSSTSLYLKKQLKTCYGAANTSSYLPTLKEYCFEDVLKSISNTNCVLTISFIPHMFDQNSRNSVVNMLRETATIKKGFLPQLNDSDSLVTPAERAWKHLADNLDSPAGYMNVIVSGPTAEALCVASSFSASTDIDWHINQLDEYISYPIHKRPWLANVAISEKTKSIIEVLPIEEIVKLFKLPHYRTGDMVAAAGLKLNTCSVVPEPYISNITTDSYFVWGKTKHSSNVINTSWSSFLRHTGIFGMPGRGKTTLIKRIIREANKNGYNVLIIEPAKREYISLLKEGINDLKVFDTQNNPLLINIMNPPEGVSVGVYCSSVLESLKASITMPDPLPSIISEALLSCFEHHGFTRHSLITDADVRAFSVSDFIYEIKKLLNSSTSTYSKDVKGNVTAGSIHRLNSLITRLPAVLDTMFSIPLEDIVTGTTLIELGEAELDQKRLLATLLLKQIELYFKAKHESTSDIKLLLIIDEAHAIFGGPEITDEDRALKSSINNLLENFIREARSQGIGVVLSDQSPDCCSADVLNLFSNVISFSLQGNHAEKIADIFNKKNRDNTQTALNLLQAKEFIFRSESQEPVIIENIHEESDIGNNNISSTEIDKLLKHRFDIRPFPACRNLCGNCSVHRRDIAIMNANNFYNDIKKAVASQAPELQAKTLLKELIKIHNKLENLELSDEELMHLHYCTALHVLHRMTQEVKITDPKHLMDRVLSLYQ